MLVAAATAVSIAFLANPGIYQPYLEGAAYLQIAQGHPEATYSYYAGRVLHPFAVRVLADTFSMDLQRAFFVSAVISLLALCVFLSLYLRKRSLTPAFLPVLVCVPAMVMLYRGYYFHDLFHAMLVAAFFLAYSYSAWIALPILFLLHWTRESTILLSGCLAVISLRRRDWALALAVALVAAFGMDMTSIAAHSALPNKHGLNALEMYALKVPYDFCNNFLGLVFWTDTNASTLSFSPKWVVNIPGHLGSIHQVGFCGFHPSMILHTLAAFLIPFGIGPGIAARMIREGRRALPQYDCVFQTAFAYGITCLMLAPVIGVWPERYVLYAWPLFWLALPELLKPLTFDHVQTIILIALHSAACVVGFLSFGRSGFIQFAMLMILMVLNIAAYYFLKSIQYQIMGQDAPQV